VQRVRHKVEWKMSVAHLTEVYTGELVVLCDLLSSQVFLHYSEGRESGIVNKSVYIASDAKLVLLTCDGVV
jgi:hypothetical protein